MTDEDLEHVYQRSMQQTALIALCNGEQRAAIAQQLVDNECCESVIEAAAEINNAASLLINVDAMQSLIDEPATHQDFDRSKELRIVFKAFYQETVSALAGGNEEPSIVEELQKKYDFPTSVLTLFVDLVESSMSPDIERMP